MAVFISVLIILVSVLLILVVLVQNSKGGGLASNFSASSQVMGVRKTADVLEKATWVLGGALLFLCLISGAYLNPDTDASAGEPTESVTKGRAPQGTSPAPAPAPQTAPPAAPTGTPPGDNP